MLQPAASLSHPPAETAELLQHLPQFLHRPLHAHFHILLLPGPQGSDEGKSEVSELSDVILPEQVAASGGDVRRVDLLDRFHDLPRVPGFYPPSAKFAAKVELHLDAAKALIHPAGDAEIHPQLPVLAPFL